MAAKAYMELSSSHMQILNSRLPAGFLLQTAEASDPHPVTSTQRRSEAEVLKMDLGQGAAVPVKRTARFKRPMVYDEDEPRPAHSDSFRKILSILHKVQRHPQAGPFMQPVDVTTVPDYLDIVREPMDLSTVEEKLTSGKYTSAYEFSADVRKIWSNAFLYNAQDTELYHTTVELSAYFESLFKGHENLLLTDRNDAIEGLYKQLEALKKEIKDIKGPKQSSRPSAPVVTPMSLQEKKLLGQNIRALQPQHLRGLIAIIKDSLPANIQGTELEFDIDTLSPKVCRDLEKYVKQCLPSTTAPPKSHPKKKPSALPPVRSQDINEKLEDLATMLPPKKDSDSESSSSSSSEDGDPSGPSGIGMDMDMFSGTDYSLWPNYHSQRTAGDHNDGFMMDFDRP